MADRFAPVDHERFLFALSRLPQLPRVVYLLHCHDGLSYAEIAFRVGEDHQQVEIYLAQALEALLSYLDRPPLQ